MLAKASEKVCYGFTRFRGFKYKLRELALDRTSQKLFRDTERDLLASGNVCFESRLEVVRKETLADRVDFSEGLLGALEGSKTNKLDSLSEFREILRSILYLFEATSNGIGFLADCKNGSVHKSKVEMSPSVEDMFDRAARNGNGHHPGTRLMIAHTFIYGVADGTL